MSYQRLKLASFDFFLPFFAFSAQIAVHMTSASSWLPSMFVLVQDHVTIGILAGVERSTTRTPVVVIQLKLKAPSSL